MFPEYQDAVALNRFKKGQLPFYIMVNHIMHCPLHHHDFAELSLVIEGSGTEIVNGKPHPMRPGTVTLLLPHHMHEIRSDTDTPIKLYCCMFDIEMMTGSKYESPVNRSLYKVGKELPSHCELEGARFDAAQELLAQIAEEYGAERFGRDAVMRAKFIETMTLAIRQMQDELPAASETDDPEEERQVSHALQFVHLHFNEPISLSVVARHFNRHVSYMSRMFKRFTGRTFQDYLHELRINRAATLLATTSMPLSEIALEAGFANYRTFTRVFRQYKNASPSEFRDAGRGA